MRDVLTRDMNVTYHVLRHFVEMSIYNSSSPMSEYVNIELLNVSGRRLEYYVESNDVFSLPGINQNLTMRCLSFERITFDILKDEDTKTEYLFAWSNVTIEDVRVENITFFKTVSLQSDVTLRNIVATEGVYFTNPCGGALVYEGDLHIENVSAPYIRADGYDCCLDIGRNMTFSNITTRYIFLIAREIVSAVGNMVFEGVIAENVTLMGIERHVLSGGNITVRDSMIGTLFMKANRTVIKGRNSNAEGILHGGQREREHNEHLDSAYPEVCCELHGGKEHDRGDHTRGGDSTHWL